MGDPVQSLELVLMQTFLVIFLGASVIRSGMLKPEDARVVGFITGHLALPLLIFRAVATARVEAVDFHAVGVLVGSKLVVQLLTMAGSTLVAAHKPGQRLLDAGLYGLYCTSSADFPIGFPVVMALFPRNRMLDFCSYLTMLAVAQDIVGNIVALVALEAGRAQQAAAASDGALDRKPTRALLAGIALNLARNHLLWMVVAGLLYKLVFGWSLVQTPAGLELPVGLDQAVEVLTSPFKFLVLFQVGISVGSITATALLADPMKCLGILLLNLIKLVFLPLLMVSALLLTWSGSLEQRNAFLTFALIYGTLPSPAAIVAFARLYGFSPDVVGLAMPVGLAMSGPIIWGVATLGHLFMHSEDNIWHGDPCLERRLQYPGLLCGLCVLALFASGDSNWRRFPMASFMLCAVAVVGWHSAKLVLLHCGCGAPAVVHYFYDFFSQQVRLCGVATVWIAWGLLRGISATALKCALAIALYALPLVLALPAALGLGREGSPFWIMACLYVRGHAQRIVDLVACGLAMAALLTATALFAKAGGFHKREQSGAAAEAGVGDHLGQPRATRRNGRALQIAFLSSFIDPVRVDSLAAAISGRSGTPAAAGSSPLGACAGESGAAAGEAAPAEVWDEALQHRMVLLPALAMGLCAVVLLPLDAALAILRPEMSAAWRAAITTGAALVHCSQGCVLLLLFLWSEPACRLYQGAYCWFAARREQVNAVWEKVALQSGSDSEEGLSATDLSSDGPSE